MKKNILVAEDEPTLTHSLKVKLEHESFSVTTVGDGWQALTTLYATNYASPIFVASNLGQDANIAKAKSLGAVDFLVKSETTLAETVRRITTHRQQ